LVFNITQQQFGLLQDHMNWVRGDIIAMDAHQGHLTFTNLHGSWELGIGEEAGFFTGHIIFIQGHSRVYTIVVNVM